MRILRRILARSRGLIAKRRLDRQLDEEIESHIQLHTDDGLRIGLSEDEARRRAIINLGGIQALKESWREQATFPGLESVWKDFVYAARNLRRNPAFAVVAILSLALGIGANTAIFTIADALLIKPIPARNPGELYTWTWNTDRFKNQNGFTLSAYESFRANNEVFSDILARRVTQAGLIGPDSSEQIIIEQVTGNYFNMLGAVPRIGRVLSPDDDQPQTTHRAAVLSHDFWTRKYAADPSILGRTIRLNIGDYTVVGVSAEEFTGLDPGYSPEIRVPLKQSLSAQPGWNERRRKTDMLLHMVGRLKPAVSPASAKANLAVLYAKSVRELAVLLPNMTEETTRRLLSQTIEIQSAARGLFGLGSDYKTSLPLLLIAAGLVLLITCVNLAALLLASAVGRQREIALRLSLGAGRGRIIRQLFTENLLVTFLGGSLSLPVCFWMIKAFIALLPASTWQILIPSAPDWRAFSFLAALVLFAAIFIGTLPALQSTKPDIAPTLKVADSAGGGRFRSGRVLVVLQIALSLSLLTGAALLLRTQANLRTLQTGFQQSGLLMLKVNPRLSNARPAAARAFYQESIRQLSALPGVQFASLDRFGLLGVSFGIARRATQVEGYEAKGDERTNPLLAPDRLVIGPDFFATVNIPLLAGREFSTGDTENSPKVAIVNERFAAYYFGMESPLGRHITWDDRNLQIIGVVKDAKYYHLREEPLRAFYVPYTQSSDTEMRASLLIRTAADPALLTPAIRALLRNLDPNMIVTSAKTVERQLDEDLYNERLLSYLFTGFGLLSGGLAGIGIFGVLAFSVAWRTREIGVRVALGASTSKVIRMVIGDVLAILLTGVAIGIPASIAFARLTSSILYGVAANDAATVIAAAFFMCAVGAVAAWIPARRAASVDPMIALRFE